MEMPWVKHSKTGKMTDERLMLYYKGTVPWELTANAILCAAVSDIEAKSFNKWLAQERKNKEKYPPGSDARKSLPRRRPYGFLTRHVGAASSPAQLLMAAINDREIGSAAMKPETLALYQSAEKLIQTYGLATKK